MSSLAEVVCCKMEMRDITRNLTYACSRRNLCASMFVLCIAGRVGMAFVFLLEIWQLKMRIHCKGSKIDSRYLQTSGGETIQRICSESFDKGDKMEDKASDCNGDRRSMPP